MKTEFQKATESAKEKLAGFPKAEKVSYNRKSKRLIVDLESGITFIIPTKLVQIFEGATDVQIADVQIAVKGLYLRWKSLDEDMEVSNLLRGVFGTQKWMDDLREHLSDAGRKGGAARTEAKRKASAENGKKGGRPKKEKAA